jgi:hypothetical protein
VHDTGPDLARARRQVVVLLVVLNALVLGIGLVASVDLRRLRTPGGTALRWVQAAVFGECDDYLRFSVAAGDVPDHRTRDALCRDLRAATAPARTEQLQIGLRLGPVVVRGDRATAEVVLSRRDEPVTLHLTLVRSEGRWRVVRDAATCESVGCA